jgi:glycosyltransferase involved in cell wall biosynthesis
MWVNEALFRHDLRKIVKNERVDILITAYSAYMTGFPPFDLSIPVVFDYLDCAEWTSSNPHVRPYIEKSDLVLAVSALAQEQAERFNDDVVYLPNGADVQLLREASGHEIRDQYDLRDATVVSLIGLMDSEYLIDAVLAAKEEMPKLKCLLVGHSRFLQSAIESNPDASDTFVYAGPVPYSKVAKYFAASDIGLYPVPGISYDDGRSPIKIFEYTAAGCPVVAPPIREVQRLGFSNVITARPEARAFAEGILQAAEHNGSSEPTVDRYDWKYLSEKLEATLQDLLLFQGV